MSYSTEANAGFRQVSTTFNAAAYGNGRVRALVEKVVEREVLMADNNNTPTSRPVNTLDARVTCEFLDQAGALSHATAANTLILNYSEANGGAASITVAALLPGTVRHNWGRNQGGFGVAQDLELEGALTYTPTA